MAKCKHGLNESTCGTCRQSKKTERLSPDAVRRTTAGDYAMVLSLPGEGKARVLVLGGRAAQIETIDESDLQIISRDDECFLKLLDEFRRLALERGHLFLPGQPLTVRERLNDPTHCYECKTELSFDKRSLGCKHCWSYVCERGHCLCGNTSRNYLGQVFSQPPGPQIPDRIEYIRIVRFCTWAAERGVEEKRVKDNRS